MAFETNDPVSELRDKAREMFPHNEELARSTYHWHAADEIERLRAALQTMNNVSLHQTDRLFPVTRFDDGSSIPSRVHPLTCGNDSDHTPLYPYWNSKRVQLICRDCDYTQDNAGPCDPAR